MRCQSVVERNSDAAGDPWAALDDAAYICFKREVASFVLHDLHSVDPLEEKTPMSPRGRVIGGFVASVAGRMDGAQQRSVGIPSNTEPCSGLLLLVGSI